MDTHTRKETHNERMLLPRSDPGEPDDASPDPTDGGHTGDVTTVRQPYAKRLTMLGAQMSATKAPAIEAHPSGGKREAATRRYDLIPTDILDRLADIYTEGAVKYGTDNWKKGLPYSSTWNHMVAHLHKWRQGDSNEDHLAKVLWGIQALMWYETHLPEHNDLQP